MKFCYREKKSSLVWKYSYNIFFYMDIYILNQAIDPMCRVFTNGLGDWGLISSRVISKTQKMVLDAALLNTQHYKVSIKGNGKE